MDLWKQICEEFKDLFEPIDNIKKNLPNDIYTHIELKDPGKIIHLRQ